MEERASLAHNQRLAAHITCIMVMFDGSTGTIAT